MRIQTILDRVEKFKSFVYSQARLEEHDDGPARVVRVRPRRNSLPHYSRCGRRGPAYDRLEERRFEFVSVWGIVALDFPTDGGRGVKVYPARSYSNGDL